MNLVTSTHRSSCKGSQSAIALIEVLATVLIMGILAAGLNFVLGGIKGGTERAQLGSHVKMLNSAVAVYRASGGEIGGKLSVAEVLTKLKSVATEESARRINGYRGATVDPRLKAVLQTPDEAASTDLRAIWNPARLRFMISTAGSGGVQRFVFDDEAEIVDPEARQGAVALASQGGGWIWDYSEFGVGAVVNGDFPTRTEAPVGTPDLEGAPRVLELNAPLFSIPGGSYEYSNFDLPLSLEDTNPAGVSQLYYSVNDSDWAPYAGSPIMVPAGATVAAYSVSLDPDNWIDSLPADEVYESSFVITGSTAGLFSNPVGGPNMVTGGWGEYFTWGTPATKAGFTDPSWILFEGASFHDVMPGEQFLLGSIEYYNGTIKGGSGANGLDLGITLEFAGSSQSEQFEYDLNLINSANRKGNTLAESADYVQFGEVGAKIPAVLGGVEYTLVLEFGETTENGFSTIDEFFVHEGESASGKLYGTLVPAWGGQG